jgi:hypothetical protein
VAPPAVRLVAQNFLNCLHVLVGKLLNHADGLEVGFDLILLGCSQQNAAHILIFDAPSEGQLDHRASDLVLSVRRELLDLFKLSLLLPLLDCTLDPGVSVLLGPGILWDSLIVLASQDTVGQGRPSGQPQLVGALVHWEIFLFDASTVEHVILGLLDLRGLQTFRPGNPKGFRDLLSTPLAGTPCESLALPHLSNERANEV